MNARKLIVLVIVAAALAGLAVVSQRKDRARTPERTGQPVLPNLPLNDVARVVVRSGGQTATLARAGEVWVSRDKRDYPVDFSKVRQSLLTLSDLKVGQVLQVNDAQRRALKLGGGGTNAAVTLYRADGSTVASLLLGDEHKRQSPGAPEDYGGYPDGRYVSADGGATVVLVGDTLSGLSADAMTWLDAELANVQATDVEEVGVSAPGQADLVFRKSGDSMVLDGLAADEEMDSGKNYTIKSGLSYLRFTDVADPALTPAQTGLDTGTVYRAVTAKGETWTATIGNAVPAGEGRYLRLAVTLKSEAPAAATNATADAASTNAAAKAAADARAKERKDLEDKVAKANAKVSGWTYVVAKAQADGMCLRRSDVVKKKAPAAPETNAAPASASAEVVTPPVAVTNAAPGAMK